MDDAVFKLGELRIVPTVSRTDKIAGYTLEAIDVVTVAIWTFFKILLRVLISAVHAAVAVMIYRAVADVVLIHQINDIADRLRVVGGIAINFHVENVAAAGQFVIRSLDLGLMARRAVIVDRHVVRVGVVDLVCDAGNHAERFAVA